MMGQLRAVQEKSILDTASKKISIGMSYMGLIGLTKGKHWGNTETIIGESSYHP